MKNKHQILETPNETVEDVTFTKGYCFDFDIDGHHISALGSAKSGKEQVFVDGEMVAQKRSFLRRSVIEFRINGKRYEIEFYMANLFTAEVHCSLIVEGTHVKTLKRALVKRYQFSAVKLAFFILVGALVGMMSGYGLMKALMDYVNA